MPQLEALKSAIRAALPDLDCVIGWKQGFDALHATPHFMRSPEDVDLLTWGPLNVHNLSVYLPALRGKKVGVVLKGCDSRSVLALLQEKLLDRENLVIFGLPCSGVADLAKVAAHAGDLDRITGVEADWTGLTVTTPQGDLRLIREEVFADKCLGCQYPNVLEADHFIGDALPPAKESGPAAATLAALEAMAPEALLAYWAEAMERCIRCHACRNACPMCVCRDHCIAQTRDPHWLSQEDSPREKLMFQLIHTMHLAGRCTQCGECQRACPAGIPILALRTKMGQVIHQLFDYQAGVDATAIPPLFTFQAEEANINERGW